MSESTFCPTKLTAEELFALVKEIDSSASMQTVRNEHYVSLDPAFLPQINDLLNLTHHLPLTNLFANDLREQKNAFVLYYTYTNHEKNYHIIATYAIDPQKAEFPSISRQTPVADQYEREIHDLFGLMPLDHPHLIDLIYHGNWPEHPYHMRKDCTDMTQPPLDDEPEESPFLQIEGSGVYQIPVGPVHAGIIEPGHFRFTVAGEPIINLETKLHYTHKGTEKLAEGMDYRRCYYLSERISGDESFSNSWAYCQAIEKIANISVPPRAEYSRTIIAEVERLTSHFGDLSGIAGDVAYLFAAAQYNMMRIWSYNVADLLVSNRFLRSVNIPGGLRQDYLAGKEEALIDHMHRFKKELHDTMTIVLNNPMYQDRMEHTGVLQTSVAYTLNATGPGGRAAGVKYDTRHQHPYGAYDKLTFASPHYEDGDVYCRHKVKLEECKASINIILQALDHMPQGDIRTDLPDILPAYACAYGMTESPRGENMHWIMMGENNTIYRYRVRTPSYCTWPAVCYAVNGNLVPDFPLINKSFNLSYSGHDL